MSCQRFREAITDHACGASLGDAAAAHLDSCARCRDAFDEEQGLIAEVDIDLGRALAITASDDFAQRVSTRVQVAHANAVPGTFATRWWLSAAAAAAVVALGVSFTLAVRRDDGASGQSVAPTASTSAQPTSVNVPAPTLSPARAASGPVPDRPPAAKLASRATGIVNRRTEPEVIVPPDQQRAITRLKELLEHGLLDAKSLPTQAAIPDLSIAPLSVPDIVVPDVHTVRGPSIAAGGAERELKE
jgi:hypothetical protein